MLNARVLATLVSKTLLKNTDYPDILLNITKTCFFSNVKCYMASFQYPGRAKKRCLSDSSLLALWQL